MDELRRFFLYLASTQDCEVIEKFGGALLPQGLQQGDEIMTYAEEVRTGVHVEMVEGLLRVGVTWDVVEAATGRTEAKFQELKAQLSGSDSQGARHISSRLYLVTIHSTSNPLRT